MMNGATVRRLSVGEVSLEVSELGPAKGPPVVLLHGFPQGAYAWRHQMKALAAAGFRAIAPDQRGYNRSDKPEGIAAYRIDRLAGDVAGLLDALELPRAHIVGHDWGGTIAWTLASLHPARVQRLVTLNGPHPRHAAKLILTNPRQLRRSWYMFLFQIPGVVERMMAQPAFVPRTLKGAAVQRGAFDEETYSVMRAAIAQPGAPRAMLSWYRAGLRERMPFLPPVLARSLVIWGDGDPALLPELAMPPERWARDVEVRHITDSGHWVPEERPDVVNEHILEFLRR
jgi:pimeloyl-ACP methyl ester carboxylesterase